MRVLSHKSSFVFFLFRSQGLFRVEYGVNGLKEVFRTAVLTIPVAVVPLLRIYNYDIVTLDAENLAEPEGMDDNLLGSQVCLFCFDVTNETRHSVSLSVNVDYNHLLQFSNKETKDNFFELLDNFQKQTGITNKDVSLEAFAVVR